MLTTECDRYWWRHAAVIATVNPAAVKYGVTSVKPKQLSYSG